MTSASSTSSATEPDRTPTPPDRPPPPPTDPTPPAHLPAEPEAPTPDINRRFTDRRADWNDRRQPSTGRRRQQTLSHRHPRWVSDRPAAMDIAPAPAPRPELTALALLTCDVLTLTSLVALVVFGYSAVAGVDATGYFELWPILPAMLGAFASARLYSPGPMTPVEEIRRMFWALTLGVLAVGAAMYWWEAMARDTRTVLALGWAACVVAAPAARTLLRFVCAPRSWWGCPVLLIGAGPAGLSALKRMKRQPELGLKPLAILDDRIANGRRLAGVPVVGRPREALRFERRRHLIALVADGDISPSVRTPLLRRLGDRFHRVVVLPRTEGLGAFGVAAVDLGGRLGIEVRHRLLDPEKRLVKRVLDLAIIGLFSPLLAPLLLGIALAVRLDSPGPVFFRQTRIGEKGKRFRIVKFRSMVQDADAVLEAQLAECPDTRRQWAWDRKLRTDPRITRVGRFLRKTSLDELPQLWNVVRGDMSLVGPRPIVEDEIRLYRKDFGLYKRVRPGLTGLWQTSGRNAVRYRERVAMDVYYVRNWSLWLDLYLLAKTVLTVALRRGV
ncbi:MAG: undecaprenyl-phosphate galactose phosphotransferase WbaP [Planctomycetota bacterium]